MFPSPLTLIKRKFSDWMRTISRFLLGNWTISHFGDPVFNSAVNYRWTWTFSAWSHLDPSRLKSSYLKAPISLLDWIQGSIYYWRHRLWSSFYEGSSKRKKGIRGHIVSLQSWLWFFFRISLKQDGSYGMKGVRQRHNGWSIIMHYLWDISFILKASYLSNNLLCVLYALYGMSECVCVRVCVCVCVCRCVCIMRPSSRR